jgi:superfamily II DNA/RNA helicase
VKTKRGADKMVKKLKEEGHSADAIHGDLRQSKRDRVINSFRKGLKRILIATDVAARGLDIPLIQHVINYDLPQVPEDYVHRIGRTARAGSEGSALTFLTPDDRLMWNSINKLIDPDFKPAPSGLRKDSKNKRRGKRPNNKKRKARDEKRLYGKGKHDQSSSFRGKQKSYGKGRSDKPSRDGEKKSFGFKGKSSFRDKLSRDGEKKSFGFKGKSSFRDKPSRDGEKKSFGFKGKSSFAKKNKSKPMGFTNNPKYFEKKHSENTSSDSEKKSFSFRGKKKFKSRNSRPKKFSFKKHSKKRARS